MTDDASAAPVAESVLYPNDAPADNAGAPAADSAAPPAEDGKKDDAGTDAAKDAADIVPDDGKYSLKMPDGVEVDQELLGQFEPRFKELGLTVKQAQALTDTFIAAQEKRNAGQRETWAKMTSDWAEQAKADADIGGAKWDSTVKSASGIVKRYGTDALREYLNSSGAGNHPEMIRLMAKVGAMIGEDQPAVSVNTGSKIARDPAAILYPDDQPVKGR